MYTGDVRLHDECLGIGWNEMIRITFTEALEAAESELLAEGALVRQQLRSVMKALEDRDVDLAEQVILADDGSTTRISTPRPRSSISWLSRPPWQGISGW